jgi:integrase
MKPKSNYISPEQFNQIVNHVPQLRIRKWNDKDVQMSMKIAYYCALRYGAEVTQLTKGAFDYDRREVYLGRTKTKKEDYAPIPDFFIPELKEFWDKKKDGVELLPDCQAQNQYLWLMKIGNDLSIMALQTPQKITGEKTKLHIFRKSWLKEIMFGDTLKKKAHLGQTQSIARHKRATTTADYLHLDIEGGKELYDNNGLN